MLMNTSPLCYIQYTVLLSGLKQKVIQGKEKLTLVFIRRYLIIIVILGKEKLTLVLIRRYLVIIIIIRLSPQLKKSIINFKM